LAGRTLKILTYNIHKGQSANRRRATLAEIEQVMVQAQADIILLQEVVGENLRWQKLGLINQQVNFLCADKWPHFAYGRNALYQHGHHGNLILSKFPIKSTYNIDLSTNPFEQRGILVCHLEIPIAEESDAGTVELVAMCVHLNLLRGGRSAQYQKIHQFIERELGHLLEQEGAGPSFIAGDFNDWNQEAKQIFVNHLRMREAHFHLHGEYARTFPAFYPMLRLDRIYTKNLEILEAGVIHNSLTRSLSDHLPLWSRVKI
jgi:endonuclease/exonuclease/phosphatase family metal-dependent hydrolase